MTSSDFNEYLSRLHADLEEGPLDAARGILNGIGAGIVVWALIGAAFAVLLSLHGCAITPDLEFRIGLVSIPCHKEQCR